MDVGFPFYSMLGEFLDVRIGDTYSLEVVVVGWWEESGFNQSFGLSSDGEVQSFTIQRSKWIPFHDKFGTEIIPLQQVILRILRILTQRMLS